MDKRRSIIISGLPAVGKTTLAEAIASRFNMRYYSGGDILKELAASKGYKVEGSDWWDREQGMRFLAERESNPEFDRQADEYLLRLVREGGIVATSYTLPWLASDDTVKIYLKGSRERRAARMATRDNLAYEEALSVVTIRDERNRMLYKSLYNIDIYNDLLVFDFVINTDHLSASSVIDIACVIVEHVLSEQL